MFFSDECSFYNAHGDFECYKVCFKLIRWVNGWMEKCMHE